MVAATAQTRCEGVEIKFRQKMVHSSVPCTCTQCEDPGPGRRQNSATPAACEMGSDLLSQQFGPDSAGQSFWRGKSCDDGVGGFLGSL